MPHRAPRQYELDWLRLLAVVFVVGTHLAQTYAYAGADPLADSTTQSPALGRVLALTAYLRMPVLFCLAGMVAVHTRGHRPLGAYLRTRAERLLPPLLLGLAVLWPVQQALESRLTGESGGLFGWGYFWFLGALAAITVVTLPAGVWLARPTVQARLARAAPKGRTLVLLAGLPLLGTLLPYGWAGDAPVLGPVDVKALVGYGGDFMAGMVLASAPAFRTTVMHRRGTALLVWALAAATQVVGPRLGVDGHVWAVAGGVASWSWVLACYGFAARYLAAPSPVLARWGPRALAVYVFHGVALAAAQCVALPLDLPLAPEVALLVTLTAGGTLALVRLAESFRATATALGLRSAPAIVARRVSAPPARPPAALDFQHLAPLKSSELEPEAGQPVRVEAPAPVPDRLHGEPEGAGDLRVALAGGRAQDDPRAAHLAVGQRARVGGRGERAALGVGERELELSRPAGTHRPS